MNYSVVLDSKNSYIIESEIGMSYGQACQAIIDYCSDSGYDLQQELWEVNKESGSQSSSVVIS